MSAALDELYTGLMRPLLAHGRDEHDRAAGFETQHLARRGGGGHEDACVVGREHLRGVGDCVYDCRASFLYLGGCIKGSEMG